MLVCSGALSPPLLSLPFGFLTFYSYEGVSSCSLFPSLGRSNALKTGLPIAWASSPHCLPLIISVTCNKFSDLFTLYWWAGILRKQSFLKGKTTMLSGSHLTNFFWRLFMHFMRECLKGCSRWGSRHWMRRFDKETFFQRKKKQFSHFVSLFWKGNREIALFPHWKKKRRHILGTEAFNILQAVSMNSKFQVQNSCG